MPPLSEQHQRLTGIFTAPFTVLRLLTEHGVPLRGRSDAERLKWQVMRQDRTLVERQLSAAWQASRARTDSEEVKIKRAIAFYHHPRRNGRYELDIMDVLTSGYGLDGSVVGG